MSESEWFLKIKWSQTYEISTLANINMLHIYWHQNTQMKLNEWNEWLCVRCPCAAFDYSIKLDSKFVTEYIQAQWAVWIDLKCEGAAAVRNEMLCENKDIKYK